MGQILRVTFEGETAEIDMSKVDSHDVAQLLRIAEVVTIELPSPSMGAVAVIGKYDWMMPTGILDEQTFRNLFRRVDSLKMSLLIRVNFEEAGVEFVCQLVEMPVSRLLQVKDFGRPQLQILEQVLEELGLSTDMNLWYGDRSGILGCLSEAQAAELEHFKAEHG